MRADHLTEARQIVAGVEQLLGIARGDIATLRKSEDLDDLQRCGELMRLHHVNAGSLWAQTEQLPLEYVRLKMAANRVTLSVSCSDFLATKHISEVKADLQATEQQLAPPL